MDNKIQVPMSAKPKLMHQVKSIFQMRKADMSIREISKQTGACRKTINEYLNRIQALRIDLATALALSDTELSDLIYNPRETRNDESSDRYKYIQDRMEYYRNELQKPGVTKTLLWHEYRKEYPKGYGHSQFCWYILQQQKINKAVYKIHHRPAQQIMVDFTGNLLSYIDRQSGEIIECEVLVCVFPFSGMAYVEVLRSQKQQDFIKGLCNALNYFGGVPLSIKCDNLKSAVVKANRYDPHFTQAMELMAAHYRTNVVTSRVRKPRDKASVENAVRLTYQRIFAPLRDLQFFSLEELQYKVMEQLDLHLTQRFQAKDYSRKELFESQEKPLLQALPDRAYVHQQVTLGKVQLNYHVILGQDYHQYSVPYTLIGKRLKIIYTSDIVEIYDDLKRVAIHKRNYKRHGYTTLEDHMPANHKFMNQYKGWDGEYFMKQAQLIGPATAMAIDHILKSRTFLEQSYNSCLGVIRLANIYTPQRLENTCALLQHAAKINYGLIARILKNNMDKQDPKNPSQPTLFDHDNLRGPNFYC
ncbi:MAG TPA: IS21 family transposase [Saprospiraceae bacterium]|nr:IS21 family transposase [Saprospiraceae bacterium]